MLMPQSSILLKAEKPTPRTGIADVKQSLQIPETSQGELRLAFC